MIGEKMIERESIYASIIGGIVGDALGVPYEFTSPTKMKENPATTMTGYGTYNQPAGSWSDDSSMTLATMDSLINGVDYDDMMTKFNQWISEGKYTPRGEVFDYGNTTYNALMEYPLYPPLECGLTYERSNGNGSLMRIMPVIIYANSKQLNIKEQMTLVDNVSSLTHAHPFSKASCNIYNIIVQEVLNNPNKNLKELINIGIDKSRKYYENDEYPCFNKLYSHLFSKDESEIASSGYVVDSLEVALYSCYHTSSYKEAVLKSINYGGDTDTNAIITGGLAGLYYGYGEIPSNWIKQIINIDYIQDLCEKFYQSLK